MEKKYVLRGRFCVFCGKKKDTHLKLPSLPSPTGICLSLHHPSAPEALIERIKFVTMKFSAILFTTLFATASAFAPATSGKAAFTARYVATDPEVSTGPSTDPVDKTLTGIDDAAEHDVFDPHAGNNPALTRNNNDEVWVPQVRACDMNVPSISSFLHVISVFASTFERCLFDAQFQLYVPSYQCIDTPHSFLRISEFFITNENISLR